MKRKSVFLLSTAILAVSFIPALASAADGYLTSSTEMHAGPDYDYPTVDVVNEGDGVVIHGCLDDYSWCDVGYRGDRGWISTDNLIGKIDGRGEPIVSIAPSLGIGVLAFSFDNYWDTYYRNRNFYRERPRWESFTSDHTRPSWSGRGGGDRRGTNAVQAQQQRERTQHNAARQDDARNGANREQQQQQQQRQQQAERAARDTAHQGNVRAGLEQQQQRQQQQAERAAHDNAHQGNMRAGLEQRQKQQQAEQAAQGNAHRENVRATPQQQPQVNTQSRFQPKAQQPAQAQPAPQAKQRGGNDAEHEKRQHEGGEQ